MPPGRTTRSPRPARPAGWGRRNLDERRSQRHLATGRSGELNRTDFFRGGAVTNEPTHPYGWVPGGSPGAGEPGRPEAEERNGGWPASVRALRSADPDGPAGGDAGGAA